MVVKHDKKAPNDEWDDDRIEQELTHSFLLGISGGWKNASMHVLKYAMEKYGINKDEDANMLRHLSKTLCEESVKLYPIRKALQNDK